MDSGSELEGVEDEEEDDDDEEVDDDDESIDEIPGTRYRHIIKP